MRHLLWMPPFFKSFILELSQFVIITCTLVLNESTQMWPAIRRFLHLWRYFLNVINKKFAFFCQKRLLSNKKQNRKYKHSWKRTQTSCSCRVTTILVKQPYQMLVWSFIKSESNAVGEEQWIILFYYSVDIL